MTVAPSLSIHRLPGLRVQPFPRFAVDINGSTGANGYSKTGLLSLASDRFTIIGIVRCRGVDAIPRLFDASTGSAGFYSARSNNGATGNGWRAQYNTSGTAMSAQAATDSVPNDEWLCMIVTFPDVGTAPQIFMGRYEKGTLPTELSYASQNGGTGTKATGLVNFGVGRRGDAVSNSAFTGEIALVHLLRGIITRDQMADHMWNPHLVSTTEGFWVTAQSGPYIMLLDFSGKRRHLNPQVTSGLTSVPVGLRLPIYELPRQAYKAAAGVRQQTLTMLGMGV